MFGAVHKFRMIDFVLLPLSDHLIDMWIKDLLIFATKIVFKIDPSISIKSIHDHKYYKNKI
jgi:hypothetical protein